jgi:hypothetical protein
MCSIGNSGINAADAKAIGRRAGDRGPHPSGRRDVFTSCASAFASG